MNAKSLFVRFELVRDDQMGDAFGAAGRASAGMEGGRAPDTEVTSQRLNARVGAGGLLAVLPEPVCAYAEAEYLQEQVVTSSKLLQVYNHWIIDFTSITTHSIVDFTSITSLQPTLSFT